MECHRSLHYVMYLGTLLFAVQLNVFISLLWFLIIAHYIFELCNRQPTKLAC